MHLINNQKNQTNEFVKNESTEKIQVILDNASMRFPSKSAVQKLIEYINFESSNKFTLIINNPSRPGTSHSPLHRKGSIKFQEEITTYQTVEKWHSRSYSQLSITADINELNNNNDEIIDQVINKVESMYPIDYKPNTIYLNFHITNLLYLH